MRKVTAIISVLFLGLFVSTTAFAADFLPKSGDGGSIVAVGGDEVYENLYVGGASVSVNKGILGDLFVGAGSVNISAETEEDLFTAGGNVNISGPVGGDARVAGGNLGISAPVSGDLLVAGGTIIIASDVSVGGDMWIAGGVVNFSGSVAGEARLAGGEIYVNGEIEGPVKIYAEKLTFGPEAVVQSVVEYHGKEEAVIQDGARVGEIEMMEFQGLDGLEEKAGKEAGTSAFWVFLVVKLLALFIAGLVLLKLFKARFNEVVSYGHKDPWKMLGIGFLATVLIPVVSLILLVTIVGAYLGILLVFVCMTFSILAAIITVFYTGSLVEKYAFQKSVDRLSWKTLLLGIIVGGILAVIPIVGWIVMLVLFLISFGATLRMLRGIVEV